MKIYFSCVVNNPPPRTFIFKEKKNMLKICRDLLTRKIIVAFMLMVGFTATNILGQSDMTAKLTPSDDEAAKKVDAFLSQWDKNDMPGGAVGVVKDGKLVYKRGFGMANLDYDVPNTPTTLFNLASTSKPFTAASIAFLAQQGKLSLDDDIRKYVPEMPKYDETISIRHLIHHTSGIRDYQALVTFAGLETSNAYRLKGYKGSKCFIGFLSIICVH